MEAVKTDFRTAPLDETTRAILEYTDKAVRDANQVTDEDIENLRRVGLREEDILDITGIAAYFEFCNLVADALGVELNPEYYSLHKTSRSAQQ